MIYTAPTSEYELKRNKPMPSFNHGSIQAKLIFLLILNYEKVYRTISELSLDLTDWPSVPDVSLYPYQKLDTKNDIIKTTEPPLLTIEILSPTQSLADLLSKANSYFQHGVKSCWIVLPGVDNIYVFSSADEYEIFKSDETLHDEKMDIKIEVGKVFE